MSAALDYQHRLNALAVLLDERGVVTREEWDEATVGAEDRWRTGALVASLVDAEVDGPLDEFRCRLGGDE
jgi:hypothetical protein